MDTILGINISVVEVPGTFEDEIPFHKVGLVSSLEGSLSLIISDLDVMRMIYGVSSIKSLLCTHLWYSATSCDRLTRCMT